MASTLLGSAGCPGLLFTFLFNLTLLPVEVSVLTSSRPCRTPASAPAGSPRTRPATPRRWGRCGVQCPFLPDPRLNPPSSDPVRSPEPGDLASSLGGHSVTRAAAFWPGGWAQRGDRPRPAGVRAALLAAAGHVGRQERLLSSWLSLPKLPGLRKFGVGCTFS